MLAARYFRLAHGHGVNQGEEGCGIDKFTAGELHPAILANEANPKSRRGLGHNYHVPLPQARRGGLERRTLSQVLAKLWRGGIDDHDPVAPLMDRQIGQASTRRLQSIRTPCHQKSRQDCYS